MERPKRSCDWASGRLTGRAINYRKLYEYIAACTALLLVTKGEKEKCGFQFLVLLRGLCTAGIIVAGDFWTRLTVPASGGFSFSHFRFSFFDAVLLLVE